MNPETISPITIEVEKVKIYEAFGGISGVLDTTDYHRPVLLVDDLTLSSDNDIDGSNDTFVGSQIGKGEKRGCQRPVKKRH
jgi:hypothetical protein